MARINLRSLNACIAGKFDFADFDFGAFLDLENENDALLESDAFVLRSDFGELAAVLTEQFFKTTSAFLIFVGSNWLSTLRPTCVP